MLQCRSLSKRYGEKQALRGVDLTVERGEVVALLGRNGAGKTTIMNCIAGITRPTEGDIVFDGISLLPESPLRGRFGILIEPVFFDYLNVSENLTLLERAAGRYDSATTPTRISELLTQVGLGGLERRKVKSFSFGMRQRLGLAQALIGNGDFLMLDEPLVGLDPPGKELFKDALVQAARRHGRAVLFSSHDLADVADVCDRIVLVREGSVVYTGTYDRACRLVVTTTPAPQPGDAQGGVEVVGDTLRLSDPAQLNTLIASGMFRDHQITDITTPDDELKTLFSD